jgi:hypothetical protein
MRDADAANTARKSAFLFMSKFLLGLGVDNDAWSFNDP